MHYKVLAISLCILCYRGAAHAESVETEFISNAYAFAKQSIKKDESNNFLRQCVSRAISDFESPPTAAGRYQLNEISVEQGESTKVSFSHTGAAYDGCNCRLDVFLDTKAMAKQLTVESLGCAEMLH